MDNLYTTLSLINCEKNENIDLDEFDECYVLEKIKKMLLLEKKENDALKLLEFYQKLKKIGKTTQPVSLMIFFYTLYQHNIQSIKNTKFEKLNLLRKNSDLHLSTQISGLFLDSNSQNNLDLLKTFSNQNQLFKNYVENYCLFNNQNIDYNLHGGSLEDIYKKDFLRRLPNKQSRPHTIHFENNLKENSYVSHAELLREILLVFQGFSGKILIQSLSNDGKYKISSEYKVGFNVKFLILRLSNMGWLYNKIVKFCEHVSKSESLGNVCKSFVVALQEELNFYTRLITMIEQEMIKNCDITCVHSFLKLQSITFDSFNRLKSLANLIDHCKHKRGGSLLNEVYKQMHHGDPMISNCIKKLLKTTVVPFRKYLSNWIFHGELDDNFKEFFVTTSRIGLSNTVFWHEKYNLNEKMLPGFITVEQAKKILATGKAVNILKQISENLIAVTYFDELKKEFENSSIESLFNESFSTKESYFQELLSLAYKETNQKAIQILFEKYNFKHHLQGIRLFLLLGQGDFIHHLMDLLEEILNKPAKQLRNYNFTESLKKAIESTNAQYLISDVIDNLDIRFLEKGLDETGWDVFTLTYQNRGPISIVLNNQCMENYSILFRYLWRVRRIEYVLNTLWKKLITQSRIFKLMPELKSVFHLSHVLLAEMIHFIQQMQFYIKFEVIECLWSILEKKINTAEDIDELIKSQETFLNNVIYKIMLDLNSKILSTQLRAIYDCILNFQNIENDLFSCIECELVRRDQFNNLINSYPKEKNFESKYDKDIKINEIKEDEFAKKIKFTNLILPNIKVKIQSLSKTYEEMVQKYLILLAEHPDADFRFLSFRLDFNEYYKKRNKSLECSFTYSKRTSIENSRVFD